jgi:hypothetical protein
MADVFTLPKLYECCPNYLYPYQHCALKGVPQSIVEDTSGVWDRTARPERHISFEAGVQEAVVCWNAPSTQAIPRRRQRLHLGARTLPPLQGCHLAFHAHVGSHDPARRAEQSLAEARKAWAQVAR